MLYTFCGISASVCSMKTGLLPSSPYNISTSDSGPRTVLRAGRASTPRQQPGQAPKAKAKAKATAKAKSAAKAKARKAKAVEAEEAESGAAPAPANKRRRRRENSA